MGPSMLPGLRPDARRRAPSPEPSEVAGRRRWGPHPPKRKRVAQNAEDSEAARRRRWDYAVAKHPFVNKEHYRSIHTSDCVVRDRSGEVVFAFVKNAIPREALEMSVPVLSQAVKKVGHRSSIFGGISPQSGIAGYYDYADAPVKVKCRKTAFTAEQADAWPQVFPLVEHVDAAYRAVLPRSWRRQRDAIPSTVRIRDTVFSTLTLNRDFRTAAHTDKGDFDGGYSCLTVLQGDFQGLLLGFPDFRVAVDVRPGDLVMFNSHHRHCNTEVESRGGWGRLSCVLYYRYRLGEPECVGEYRRRLEELRSRDAAAAARAPDLQPNRNGRNSNEPTHPSPRGCSPLAILEAAAEAAPWAEPSRQVVAALRAAGPAAPYPVLVGRLPPPAAPMDPGWFVAQSQHLLESPEPQMDWHSEEELAAAGEDLLRVWRRSVEVWVDALLIEWCAQQYRGWKTSTEVRTLSWPEGPLQDRFRRMCELSQSVAGAAEQPRQWIESFAAFAADQVVLRGGVPPSALPPSVIQREAAAILGSVPEPTEMPKPPAARTRAPAGRRRGGDTPWAADDSYDFQSEDRPVDYAAIGLCRPGEAFRGRKPLDDPAPRASQGQEPSLVVVALPSLSAAATPVEHQAGWGTAEDRRVFNAAARQYPRPAQATSVPGCSTAMVRDVSRCTAGAADCVLVGAEVSHLWSDQAMVGQLKAAARALRTGGVLFLGSFTDEPLAAATLKSHAAASHSDAVQSASAALAARYAGGSAGHLRNPAAAASAVRGCGLEVCGTYHVAHSALNEFVSVALKR